MSMLRLALVLLCGLLLAGCAGAVSREAPTPLRLEPVAVPAAYAEKLARLSVETPRIGAAVDHHDLLYSEEDFLRRPYARVRWGAPLGQQLGDLVVEQLTRSGLVGAIQQGGDPRLEIEVVEWLHDYRGEAPEARLALRSSLYRGERVVAQWRWSDSAPFSPEGPLPGLAAQQRLLEAWLAELLAWLDGLPE
ncbi:ABC-type transport auxiliary lipoprotein family protein [Halomonas sp. 328]|uniref:ABC-type transport auxiliary lipoprotein family protein n=1 Tax=Halomonas sp. 328 TaxID=2776704 RepID=UPI0018A78D69|nr:ABC-type transport auxiliary lipoprotein family protein [Halomonas sp. 328]MBF8222710.1 membrane integrity-associated transporter subunit PqiC [Halomonas sp. 328]